MSNTILNGYCTVGSNNIECFFTLHDFKVTLIVKNKIDLDIFIRWSERYINEEIIYGTTSHGKNIILIRTGSNGFTMGGNDGYESTFYTKYYLIGDEVYDKPRDSFKGLVFYSEAIDDVIPKVDATEFDCGLKAIKLKNPTEYIKEYRVEHDNNRFNIYLGINYNLICSFKDGYELNNKYSYIKIVFDKEQRLTAYWIYHEYITNLLVFCLGHKDIKFKVKMLDYITLPRKISKIKFRKRLVKRVEKYYRLYKKQIFPVMDYNFCWSSMQYKSPTNLHHVILLKRLNKHFSQIFYLLSSKDIKPVLDFLPEDVQMRGKIKPIDIGLICAALEREFSFYEADTVNVEPSYYEEARRLSKKLKYEVNSFEVSDIIKAKAYQLISSLRHMVFSLTEKAVFLMKRFETVVYRLTHKNSQLSSDMLSSEFKDINEFKKKFINFQKMRNSGSHGIFVWDDSFKIYIYLVIVIYVSILYRSGYNDEEIIDILGGFFGYQL